MVQLNARGGWDITDAEAAEVIRLSEQHRCDEHCVCPEHRTPMIYWPMGDDHACQDVTCEYGHGTYRAMAGQWQRRHDRIAKEFRTLEDQVTAALSAEAHHRVIIGGLPYCSCQDPLKERCLGEDPGEPHYGDATGALITHLLAVARASARPDA